MASIAIDRRDGLSSSTAIKGPVRVATTANITLVGLQTIDGVVLASGDRVLVKDQDTAGDNGIWVVDTGSWRRAKDFSRNDDVRTGTQVYVTDGDLYASSGWYVSSGNPTFGTSSIEFTQNVLLNAAQLVALEEEAGESADAAAASEVAAEAAKDAAEAAKVIAEAAAAGIEGASVYSTVAQASVITPVAAPDFIRTAGYSAAGDGGGATYKKVASEPSHEGKFSITLADDVTVVWYEITGMELNVFQFGAVDDGVTPAQDAINAALICAKAIGAWRVGCGQATGAFLLTGTVFLRDYVTFFGNRRASLKQADGAELLCLVDYLLSQSAQMQGWVIDGNRQNNTDDGVGHVTVRIGGGIDSVCNENIIKNSPGYSIVVNTGLRADVRRNTIYNFFQSAVTIYGVGGQHAKEVSENFIHTVGWGALGINDTRNTNVRGNTCFGGLIGDRFSPLAVNTSGTTVTWVSGPTFENVVPGSWMVIDNGKEFRIKSVDSPTQLTTDPAFNGSMPTLTNALAGIGSGDLVGAGGAVNCSFTDNQLDGSATFLFGFVIEGGANNFDRNKLSRAGKCAIILVDAVGSLNLSAISFTGNIIDNAGCGGGIGEMDRIAINITATAVGKINNIGFYGNIINSFAGDGQTTYWLGVNSLMSPGSIVESGNQANGLANDTIYGDILSIELSEGWGSTASVTYTRTTGDTVHFDVLCSGTGFVGNPTYTVTKIVEKNGWKPIPDGTVMLAAAGGVPGAITGQYLSDRGVWKGTVGVSPGDGHIYSILLKN